LLRLSRPVFDVVLAEKILKVWSTYEKSFGFKVYVKIVIFAEYQPILRIL